MKRFPVIDVIIPAYNEENSVGNVIRDIPQELVREIIVINNNSNDRTSLNARDAGATVLDEPLQGYGIACLKGLLYLSGKVIKPDIVVFIDADYSDDPSELNKIIKPIIMQQMDLVIGSRALGIRQKGSMTFPQIFGNLLATRLIMIFYKTKFTDLGPFRAIRYDKLMQINMQDKTYGWTVEMQLKAAKLKMNVTEVPVTYRKRIGHSKISGTVKGTLLAGYKIITTIFKYL
ncbi:MAG: glycosyltransferase family 2 protein [Bacteroidia bacterium]|nr:glycosyltransferase family 2 protein [Bacteroidia bacterium]